MHNSAFFYEFLRSFELNWILFALIKKRKFHQHLINVWRDCDKSQIRRTKITTFDKNNKKINRHCIKYLPEMRFYEFQRD